MTTHVSEAPQATAPAQQPERTLPDGPNAGDRSWPLAQRIAFRFQFSFLLIDSPRFVTEVLPYVGWADRWYKGVFGPVTAWVGRHVLHLSAVGLVPDNGSDSVFTVVGLFWFAGLAMVVTIVWSVVDRHRTEYRRLNDILRVYARFVVCAAMIAYGVGKVLLLQMSRPHLAGLMTPLGQAPRHGLLWVSMGAAPIYEVFAGAVELLGGILLAVRRTTLLGALLSAGALANVFMLNIGYDVNVKRESFQLLLMSVLVALPDLGRLGGILLLDQGAPPPRRKPLFSSPAGLVISRWLGTATLLVLVTWNLLYAVDLKRKYGDWAPVPPQRGAYEVESVTRKGAEISREEWLRWGHVAIDRGNPGATFMLLSMRDSLLGLLPLRIDTVRATWTFSHGPDSLVWRYARPDAERIVARGPDIEPWLGQQQATRAPANDSLEITLRRLDLSKLPINAPIHWIHPM